MALVRLLGEQVNVERKVDERTAASIEEILVERDYQDLKWGKEQGAPAEATAAQIHDVCLANDKKWSGSDWVTFIDRYKNKVTSDMTDPENRRMFVKIAALALAALRVS